jgi:hypothetical protein
MTLPNSSIVVTPGSGATQAYHTKSSKAYPIMLPTLEPGQLNVGQSYTIQFARGSPSLNQYWFDVWNPTGSGLVVRIHQILLHCDMQTITPVNIGLQQDINLTSTKGTFGSGGDIIVATGASADVTVRWAPSSPTLRSLVCSRWWDYEETSIAMKAQQAFPLWPPFPLHSGLRNKFQPIILRENEGMGAQNITNTTLSAFLPVIHLTVDGL